LYNLSQWCAKRFGDYQIEASKTERKFDLPWIVMDSTLARATWNWSPKVKLESILEEITKHAESNPHWLEISVQKK
jgi:CDP-paratose 2-epimerase